MLLFRPEECSPAFALGAGSLWQGLHVCSAESTACLVAWASGSGGVCLARFLVPGGRKGCWPVAVPVLALLSPGVV